MTTTESTPTPSLKLASLKLVSPPAPVISDDDVRKAVEIICAECFGAMSFVNAIGGMQTTEWQIIHNNTWAEVYAEAKRRNLPFEEMKCAVTDTPLTHSATFQYMAGNITKEEKSRRFYAEVKTNGKWAN